MGKRLMMFLACMFLFVGMAMAQTQVTGTVISADDGQPIVGASVMVVGTKSGTVTDADGNFTLNAPKGSRLHVSYIGMVSQYLPIRENMKITLKSAASSLNEVVVVGYGSGQKLGTVVGSVAKVDAEKIDNKPVANVLDALQGQVPGLNILTSTGDPGDASTNVSAYVRGLGSLSAGSDPLFVVDGTPASSDILRMLNSNDIESITVLKDASATSIYGSRASNGVIYITTKKGKAGQKAVVQLSQSIGWSSLARRISNPMNASELLQYQRDNGIIDQDYYDTYKKLGNDWDWQKYFFKDDAPLYQTNFSIRGGSDKVTYYTSASKYKENGLTPASSLDRYTFRTNLDAKPLDWLSYGVNLNLTYDKRRASTLTYQGSNYTQGPIMGVEFYAPYWETPYNDDGSPKDVIPGLNGYSLYYIEAKQPKSNNDIQTNSSAYIQLNPVKGLIIRSQLGVEASETRNTAMRYYSYNGRSTYRSEAFSRFSLFTITNTAEYKFNIGDIHRFTILGGQEGIKGQYYQFSARTLNQTDDRLNMLSNGTSADLAGTTDSSYKYEYLSFFGRVDYSLMDKYFADFTVRNDQSSRFGKDNRSAWFFSGGLMWDMKKEAFLSDVNWLSALQLKGSVGSTGNSSIGNYDHLALTSTTQYGGSTGWLLGNPGNEDLGWEKQVQTNVGVSATFLNRYNADFSFYNRNTSNMLMEVPVPETTGYSQNWENVGSMRNQGIEINLSADVVKTKAFLLNLHANYSFNSNKITKLFYGLKEWPMLDYLTSYNVGKSIDFYMPIYAGVDEKDGAPMWYKSGYKGGIAHEYNDKTMTKDYDQSALSQDTGKKMYAPHYGGFGLTASWKGLTLDAEFTYVLGKYLVNNDRFFADNPVDFGGAGYNQSKDVLKSWTKEGDITDEPAFQYERQFDTHLLENASFMRLKNLTLSYDFPKSWMYATHFISNFRLILTGRNLFTVTKYSGADPEIDSNLTYGAFPSTRQVTIGAEITF